MDNDDVRPSSEEAVSMKLKEAEESLDRCDVLVKEIKRLMGVVLKGGKGYITK